ncbi:NAD(P)-dependent oxidoreductase [Solimonas flava]|uniref:NAD(P)-dependent oxidoreductase n=1 Tax=Solimonas flava TaxID=415849 RepID=UPI000416A4F5|nr:NAD(P)-dependent oxidoreductase [Solimonas flava]
MDIGFVGLGGMGRGIAANLLKAGHRVVVWNRSQTPVRELVALGAEAAATVDETLRGTALFSMLADDAALREVLLDSGALGRAATGLVHVNLATISTALARELDERHAENGLGYVSAPVFGRPDAAAAGTLQVLAAGREDAVDRVLPLLAAIGQKTWRLGEDPVRANALKISGNFMIAAALEAMGEAAALGQAYGVSPTELIEMLTGTLFAAPVYKNYGALIAERRYEPAGFKLRLGLKDVRLALAAGDAAQVPLPLASLLRDAMLEGLAAGDGDADWSVIARLAARRAGQSESGERARFD